MPASIKINWSFNVSIDGGPSLSESQPSIEVSAYDYIKTTLPALPAPGTPSSTVVNLQPITTAGAVSMVAILASKYSDKIKYNADSGTDRVFDGPLVLVGAGAVGFLAAAPKLLTFKSELSEPVTVQVLVGRTA